MMRRDRTLQIRLAQLQGEFHVSQQQGDDFSTEGDQGFFLVLFFSPQDFAWKNSTPNKNGEKKVTFKFYWRRMIFLKKIVAKHNPSMPVTFGWRSKKVQIISWIASQIRQECPFYTDMIGTTGAFFPMWLGYLPYASWQAFSWWNPCCQKVNRAPVHSIFICCYI